MTIGLALPPTLDLTDAPTSRISEAQLEQGYAGPARVEPCACGGAIWARSSVFADITEAVSLHNATRTHELWRARREEA